MSFESTTVGLDMHARSATACAMLGPTGEIITTRLSSDHTQILDWLHTLPALVRAVYEAGPTGFARARSLTGAGIGCVVAVPPSSSGLAESGSRPITATHCTWPGCCAWARPARSPCPPRPGPGSGMRPVPGS
ncbi:hypothetical protein [Allosalinactinospora lopnorensis]|uniref:hypothetical protein n=1 Tax=Allosalinactinospora lopnorensis TaxID=1352348 RepID=UPI00191BFE44|nr:hypothetical protein [Allosalinactinospora lopnorensis]